MPFRRKRDTSPGDREVHELYGAEDARPSRYVPRASDGRLPDAEESDDGFDDADDDRWSAFGEDGFFHEEHKPRGPIRRTLGCIIPLALVGGIAFGGYTAYQYVRDHWGSPSCRFVANGYDYQWDPGQSQSAATIVAVGVFKKGVPARAAVVATTTAIQESKLRNLAYGDLDSLGLFQQRASQGWGTTDQIQDPIYSSGSFYNALLKVPGWESMPIGEAAQEVQRSGYPDAYADHETQGEVLTSVMTGAAHEAIGCRLDATTANGSPARIVAQLAAESGLTAQAGSGEVTYQAKSVDGAFAIASWAIAHAEDDNITAVTVGDRSWARHRGRDGWVWHPAKQPTGSSTLVRIDVETGK